jgi:hypothetical protein
VSERESRIRWGSDLDAELLEVGELVQSLCAKVDAISATQLRMTFRCYSRAAHLNAGDLILAQPQVLQVHQAIQSLYSLGYTNCTVSAIHPLRKLRALSPGLVATK